MGQPLLKCPSCRNEITLYDDQKIGSQVVCSGCHRHSTVLYDLNRQLRLKLAETENQTCPVCDADNEFEAIDGLHLTCRACHVNLIARQSGDSDGEGTYHETWALERHQVAACPNCVASVDLSDSELHAGKTVRCVVCDYTSTIHIHSQGKAYRLVDPKPPVDPHGQEGVKNLLAHPVGKLVKNLSSAPIVDQQPIVIAYNIGEQQEALKALEECAGGHGVMITGISDQPIKGISAELVIIDDPYAPAIDRSICLDLDVVGYKVLSDSPLKIQIDYQIGREIKKTGTVLKNGGVVNVEYSDAVWDRYSLIIDGPLAASTLDELRRRTDRKQFDWNPPSEAYDPLGDIFAAKQRHAAETGIRKR